jgi:hypothetical protein
MQPHREEDQKALDPSATPKLKRFRMVKLEERIAPAPSQTTACITHGPCKTQFCNATHSCGSAGSY